MLGKPGATETDRGDGSSRTGGVKFSGLSAFSTWEEVVVVAVTVRGGAAVGAAGPLPLPGGQHGQLRGPDGALAHPGRAVARVPVLGRASGPFGRSHHLLVLLGEEDGRAAADLRSHRRRGHAQF